ncbi:hypothetical protein RRF57_003034 [Xylaria bambusicola]|uniref:Uncharacterized protein n=1 Tax=Xylaria bambusicola TaxID=326684 RepID=A0AAN7UTP4_9PEZI
MGWDGWMDMELEHESQMPAGCLMTKLEHPVELMLKIMFLGDARLVAFLIQSIWQFYIGPAR